MISSSVSSSENAVVGGHRQPAVNHDSQFSATGGNQSSPHDTDRQEEPTDDEWRDHYDNTKVRSQLYNTLQKSAS